MRNLIFLFIGFLIFLSNCGDNGDNPQGSSEIWPMAEGNYWTYFVDSYRSSQKDSFKRTDTITYSVGSRMTLNNSVWYRFGIKDKKYSMLAQNRSDGLWMIEVMDTTNINPETAYLKVKYPTNLGDETFNKADGNTLVTVNLNEKQIVPAGSFDCLRYSMKNQDIYPDLGLLMSPGVGFISQEFVTMIDKTQVIPDSIWISWKLAEYIVK